MAATNHLRVILALGALSTGALVRAEAPPPAVAPRAISGDRAEPRWDEMVTITVGQASADMVGSDDRVLQAAVDYVTRLGGGTVRVLPGTYRLRNSIFLRSHLRLIGSGPASILFKEPSHTSKLAQGSDWYDQEITLTDPAGFRVGDGVCLKTRNPHNNSTTVLKRTLVARSGARFKLDRALRENFWLQGEATATSVFPILCGEEIADVTIEDIALDGNRQHNDNLDGNYSGCIFLQDCKDITIRRVEARNNNGDGISWQICHDVRVEDCDSHDHAGLGLHPGSGSQRPVIRGNKLRNNDIGLFFCWGVRGGLAEKNLIEDNKSFGISIGHKDTDNLVRDNDVRRSGKAGILFRPERGPGFAPDRNRFERNRIIDSGPDAAAAIDIQGVPDGVVLEANEIRETRGPATRVGIRIAASAGTIHLRDNTIDGVATPVLDQRKK
jgi:hypothetical protein